MRQGRSSIKHEIKEMEIEKKMSSNSKGKVKEEGHLSGAYIRSLVKQLTSSKPKDPKDQTGDANNSVVVDSGSSGGGGNLTKLGQGSSETTTTTTKTQQQQQHHKKQVRRRLHTSRPYQERLLNMAEARREIVTALKFHRAAMKQAAASEPQNQPPQLPQPAYDQSGNMTGSRTAPYQAQDPLILWPHNSLTIPNLPFDPHNLPLPNQALGLNLNLHDFTNIDLPTPFQAATTTTTTAASSSSSSSASALSPSPSVAASGGGGLHAAMDEEEIAEIRSIGEQHQMEWGDTMSMVTSAYWFKFLKPADEEDHDHFDPFHDHQYHQLMEFPSWLGPNDNHHLDDHYSSDDYFHSPSLPCMDIGEIEGMDGDDWLA